MIFIHLILLLLFLFILLFLFLLVLSTDFESRFLSFPIYTRSLNLNLLQINGCMQIACPCPIYTERPPDPIQSNCVSQPSQVTPNPRTPENANANADAVFRAMSMWGIVNTISTHPSHSSRSILFLLVDHKTFKRFFRPDFGFSCGCRLRGT